MAAFLLSGSLMIMILLFLIILLLAAGSTFFWTFLFGLLVIRPFTWRLPRVFRWLIAVFAGLALTLVCSNVFEKRHPAYLALAFLLNILMSWFFIKRRAAWRDRQS